MFCPITEWRQKRGGPMLSGSLLRRAHRKRLRNPSQSPACLVLTWHPCDIHNCVQFKPRLPGIQIQTSRFRALRSFTVGGRAVKTQVVQTMFTVLASFDSHYHVINNWRLKSLLLPAQRPLHGYDVLSAISRKFSSHALKGKQWTWVSYPPYVLRHPSRLLVRSFS